MDYQFDFKNKSVLITGAASGIGLECSRAFLSCGADVYMADNNDEKLNEEFLNLKKLYPERKIFSFVCDISDDERRRELINLIRRETGRVDVLLNNAGISRTCYSIKENQEAWEKIVSINLTAQFFVSQLIADEFMIGRKKGKIVNMCSLGGILGIGGAAAYSASKGGVLQMTKSLACEWARFGLNVNAVCPGFVETPLIKDNLENEKWVVYMNSKIPFHRLAKPEDVAGSVLFLSSDMAEYITGTSIVVDGGYSAN